MLYLLYYKFEDPMKKIIKVLSILMLSLPFLSSAFTLEAAPRKKKKKVTQVRKQRRAKPKRVARVARFDAFREQQQALDSLRILNGGVQPIIADIQIPSAEVEPLTTRFRRGDTTLTRETIKALYYGHQSKVGEGSFLDQVERDVDLAISKAKFEEAFKGVQKGLWRNPMHFSLIKRACDLAHHQKNVRTDVYVWQIVELFSVVESTGTGESREKAYQVMSVSDALLYEMLWLDTPKENIGARNVTKVSSTRQVLTLEVRDTSGATKLRHYSMPIPI